ncbi:MAG: hypothetical protein HQL03_14530, partial [Nitrospirae bacterium]|nr:hypothetical protein [Nitrospirota bacterium]
MASILLTISLLFVAVFSGEARAGGTGTLDAPAAPTNANSAMYTLTDIYNQLNTGTAGTKRTTTFGEPSGAPADATGFTLNDIQGKLPALDGSAAGVAEVATGKTFW